MNILIIIDMITYLIQPLDNMQIHLIMVL